jgi:lactoylglutathione lyase
MYIDHIAIWTFDLEREKDFFLKYFDCTVNEKYENPVKRLSSFFITFPDGSRIELMSRDDIKERPDGENLGFAHIALNPGNMEKVKQLTERLENDGFTVKSGPRVTGDGYYESVVLDPENNVIEITSI